MKNTKITWTNNHARTSAYIYAEAVLEACEKAKIPWEKSLDVLVNADEYPKVTKISEVEFAIGWLHGCAETLGITIDALWASVGGKRFSRANGRAA